MRLGSVSEQPQRLHGRRSADCLRESLGVQLQVMDKTRRSDSISSDVVLAMLDNTQTSPIVVQENTKLNVKRRE